MWLAEERRKLADRALALRHQFRDPKARSISEDPEVLSDQVGLDRRRSSDLSPSTQEGGYRQEVAESVIVESYEHQPDRRAGLRQLAYSLVAEKCLTILSAYHCGHGVSGFAAS